MCALDKSNKLKTNKQSTHHTWDSRNCTNTDGVMEWFKPWTIERFGEDVCLLVVHMYEFKTHHFIFHQVLDEVVTYLYVLRLWMLNWILREVYSTSVVIEHTHCILRDPIVVKQLLHQRSCVQQLPVAMYSSFAVKRDIEFCFLLIQETRLLPR